VNRRIFLGLVPALGTVLGIKSKANSDVARAHTVPSSPPAGVGPAKPFRPAIAIERGNLIREAFALTGILCPLDEPSGFEMSLADYQLTLLIGQADTRRSSGEARYLKYELAAQLAATYGAHPL
jgi:hypothetical protein